MVCNINSLDYDEWFYFNIIGWDNSNILAIWHMWECTTFLWLHRIHNIHCFPVDRIFYIHIYKKNLINTIKININRFFEMLINHFVVSQLLNFIISIVACNRSEQANGLNMKTCRQFGFYFFQIIQYAVQIVHKAKVIVLLSPLDYFRGLCLPQRPCL
jgi:hypothetical protein